MRPAASESNATSWRVLVRSVIAFITCAALVATCSSSPSRSTRAVGTATHTTASTTTSAAPRTTTTTAAITYHVKRGDRLTTIAQRFHVPIAAIVFVNHLADPDRLSEGQALRIPTHPPLMLVVTPSRGQPGQSFELDLIGAKRSEVIKFEIASPAGNHTGPPHIASADGSVTTRYQTSVVNQAGTYKITARGNKGTRATARFRVVQLR